MTNPERSDADLRWLVDGDEEDRARIDSMAVLSAEERAVVLEEFTAAARDGGPAEAHLLALALSAAGMYESAIGIFQLVLQADPECVSARLNLAVVYLMLGLPGLALEELEHATGTAGDGRLAMLVEARLGHLRHWRASRQADITLRERRVAALREKDQYGEAVATDYRDLGRLLFLLLPEPTSEVGLDEAIVALERARAAAPSDLQVLEDLTIAYQAANRVEDMAGTLRILEQIAPHSKELERARRHREEDADNRALLKRKLLLIEQIVSGDAPSPAAVEEMRMLAKLFPRNPEYQAMLMIAVWRQGNLDEAVRMADDLVRAGNLSHNDHFNIAQVYWAAGKRTIAKRHLQAAEDTAADDQDRADVVALRSMLKDGRNAG